MNINLLNNTDSHSVSIIFNSLVLANVDLINNNITINSQLTTETSSLITSIISINNSPPIILPVIL